MKVCIHRGTQEIGGTCVEIESQDKRLVLNVGLPLDASDPDCIPLHPIKGFDAPDESLLGVVISHPHQDHYGLAHRLPEATPFLIGKAAEAIHSAAVLFSPAGLKLKNVKHLVDRTPIVLGPFTITPFLVDHSAYDSYAVLVEAEGKRLFYTGDFRSHGRKASLTDKLIENPPKTVDILLMEGTCVGREDKTFRTQDELVPQFADIFQKTPGMPLVWCSGQNLDRIVTIWKACIATKRSSSWICTLQRFCGRPTIHGCRRPNGTALRSSCPRANGCDSKRRKHRTFPTATSHTASPRRRSPV
jgi:ribonuclease J